MDQGNCIPATSLSTRDMVMSTYNSANLNKLHPDMEACKPSAENKQNKARTGSHHKHYLKMFSFFITLIFFKNTFSLQ